MSDDRPTEDSTAVPPTDDVVQPAENAVPPTGDRVPTTEDAATTAPVAALRLRTLLIIAAVLFGLDLLTKIIAVANLTPGDPVPIIGDFARFSLVRNPGAAFSMATGMTWLLTLVAAAVVVGVIRIGRTLRSLWWAIGLGMVLGGALGNLVDRLFRAPGPLQGHVVDFVAIGWWPVFNVADSSIVCGAILLVVLTVFGFEPDGSRAGRGDSDIDDADDAIGDAAETDPPDGDNADGGAKCTEQGNAA